MSCDRSVQRSFVALLLANLDAIDAKHLELTPCVLQVADIPESSSFNEIIVQTVDTVR
jgi:hypothetical protein